MKISVFRCNMARLLIFGWVLAGFVLPGAPALALIEIDITRGKIEPLPIAITDLLGGSDKERRFGRDIAAVIEQDLSSSGLSDLHCPPDSFEI